MDKITLNMENLSGDEREQLIKLVEKANKKENNKVWKPGLGDRYWYIGRSVVDDFVFDNDEMDNFLCSIGNCFKTEEDVLFAIEKAKVIAELKWFAKENNKVGINWTYCIYYVYENDSIITYNHSNIIKSNTVYFSSEEIAKAAIKTIGEDRLKKYYFEIGE